MNPAVLSWNAASNNQALNARQTSYILNSISAYRTAQDNKLPVADDIFFVPALKGPRGTRWASEHVMGIYAIWSSRRAPDVAKQFLLDLIAHYRDAVMGSKLYNSPPTGLPGRTGHGASAEARRGQPLAGAGDGERSVRLEPADEAPADRDGAAVGDEHRSSGPANPAESEVFDTFVLPTMFANAATGRMTRRRRWTMPHQQVSGSSRSGAPRTRRRCAGDRA